MKKFILSFMIIVTIFSIAGSGALAAFSDTETSYGNSFAAGEWGPRGVTVICPNGGEVWYIYQTVAIRWSADDVDGVSPAQPLTIDIYFDAHSGNDGFPYHIATFTQTAAGNAVYWWHIPYHSYLISHTCRVRIVATDKWGYSGSDESDVDFCPDELPEDEEMPSVSDNLTTQDPGTIDGDIQAVPAEVTPVEDDVNTSDPGVTVAPGDAE